MYEGEGTGILKTNDDTVTVMITVIIVKTVSPMLVISSTQQTEILMTAMIAMHLMYGLTLHERGLYTETMKDSATSLTWKYI